MLLYLYPLLTFLIAALTVIIITPIVRQLALRWGHIDQPDSRKIHKGPMVRLGGIGIFSGFGLALLVVYLGGGFQNIPIAQLQALRAIGFGALAYFAIGLLDDFLNLPALLRLVLQIIVAIMVWVAGVQIGFLTLPGWGLTQLSDVFSLVLTVVWFVGMTNAINWIDGLDGLAAGISGIAAISMFFICLAMQQTGAAIFAAALAGSSFGFLRYNFNPAKIFMGDGGSYFLGFTLAGIGVVGLVKSVTTMLVLLPSVVVSLPYVILALPILDMSVVIVDRLRSGQSPFIADKRHLHHRLMNAGLSHRRTVFFMYTLAIWIGSLAFACFSFAQTGLLAGVLYFIPATGLLVFSSWRVWCVARRPNR